MYMEISLNPTPVKYNNDMSTAKRLVFNVAIAFVIAGSCVHADCT